MAFVQTSGKLQADNVSGAQNAVMPSNWTAGNLGVILFTGFNDRPSSATINGGSATLDVEQPASANSGAAIYSRPNLAGGNNTLSISVSAGDFITWSGEEWSGMATSSYVRDVNSGTTGTTTAPAISTDTSPQVGDVVVAVVVPQSGGSTPQNYTNPGGIFTARFVETDFAAHQAGHGTSGIVTSAGTQTATWGATSDVHHTVVAVYAVAGGSPPVITVQPASQTVNDGATATFTVTATGATSYQWKKNGSNVGTSSSSYALTATYADQGAQITVDCINVDGTTTSTAATLRVAFELSGTGPRAYPVLGAPWASGSFEGFQLGTLSASGSHATSGSLSAQAATIAGSANHLTLHTTTCALAAQAATIAGAAAHQHATTGALAAQAATVAGSANHATLHATSGALSAQAATISGAAQHQHATTGALSAQSATIAGAADHTAAGSSHATSGALAAQDAAIAGSATHLTLHTTTGALAAQASTVSGVAVHPHTTTGALSAEAATISGAATHPHTTSGALAAQAATVVGSAAHSAAGTHSTTGLLQASAASVSGSAEHISSATNSGGWWIPPRRKKKEEPEETVEAPVEEPTAMAVALEKALTKTKVGDRAAEKAAREFAASLVARRQEQEWLAEQLRLEQELRRKRDEEETALLFILTARRRSRQPA